jgi:hypothetical protein
MNCRLFGSAARLLVRVVSMVVVLSVMDETLSRVIYD